MGLSVGLSASEIDLLGLYVRSHSLGLKSADAVREEMLADLSGSTNGQGLSVGFDGIGMGSAWGEVEESEGVGDPESEGWGVEDADGVDEDREDFEEDPEGAGIDDGVSRNLFAQALMSASPDDEEEDEEEEETEEDWGSEDDEEESEEDWDSEDEDEEEETEEDWGFEDDEETEEGWEAEEEETEEESEDDEEYESESEDVEEGPEDEEEESEEDWGSEDEEEESDWGEEPEDGYSEDDEESEEDSEDWDEEEQEGYDDFEEEDTSAPVVTPTPVKSTKPVLQTRSGYSTPTVSEPSRPKLRAKVTRTSPPSVRREEYLPSTVRAYVLKHQGVSESELLRYYSKRQIMQELNLGKIYRTGGKYGA